MKIVMLDKKTLGDDCDLSELQKMGDFIAYDETDKNHTIERIKDADAVFTNKVVIGKDEIDNASNLKYIGIMATGTNNIDLEYAGKRGITVTNVKGYSTKIVAQHTFALLFSVMEQIAHYDKFIKSGEYSGQSLFTNIDRPFMEISGKTWGVIGLGAIGAKVANAAHALGMNIVGNSVVIHPILTAPCEMYDDISEMVKVCDYITIHVPSLPETKGMINKALIDNMKEGAIILNFARPDLVVNEDILAGLESGKLRKYLTDLPSEDLIGKTGVIATPHLGASTAEAEENCAAMAVDELMDYLEKGTVRNSVNFPAVELPAKEGFKKVSILFKGELDVEAAVKAAYGSVDDVCVGKSRSEYGAAIALVPADASGELSGEGILRVREL